MILELEMNTGTLDFPLERKYFTKVTRVLKGVYIEVHLLLFS
jgi:hypothetical protein